MMELRTSEQTNEIAAALARAQAELENVARDRENPHFRSHYATLGGVLDEVRPKLAKHGIGIMQMPVNGDGISVGVITRLMHASGQWVEGAFFVVPSKPDAQGAGSALTYCRRYSLMAVAGVGPDDDDGEAAVARPHGQPRPNGTTRIASAPPPPAPPQINTASLPPSPEETPDITAARQRVRMLIDQLAQRIKTAPNRHALDLVMEDGRDALAEIEAAGEKGRDAAAALRRKYDEKAATFEDKAA